MTSKQASPRNIIYTWTDEAPALATHSLLPVIKGFLKAADIHVETRDISLAARIKAAFSDRLKPEQKQTDDLAELGELCKTASANIIKLPNISASIPQLKQAIAELQDQGFDVPDYPEDPKTAEQKEQQERYAQVLGSAVNPVLREGNSDRRVALPVKEYAQAHPHRLGAWSQDSKTHVAHMQSGDFYASEKSVVSPDEDSLSIVWKSADGQKTTVLKDGVAVQRGEVLDAARMSAQELRGYLREEIGQARSQGLLLSLHLKATMMKVSDPIIFGHAVSVYFEEVLTQYAERIAELNIDTKQGLGHVFASLEEAGTKQDQEILQALRGALESGPKLAMVDSDKGITNLHVPSDVIIDASIPAMIKSSGKMWGPDGQLHDTKALIPDRSYARMYQEVISFCREHGAFDPATMGNVANIGLMAQKAEEYGSHNKTFEIEAAGTVQVINQKNEVLLEHSVEAGDIWRMCQTKDLPIRDWVKLGLSRAKATGDLALFWLDEQRAHDAQLIKRVREEWDKLDTDGIELVIQAPVEAMKTTLARVAKGQNSIAITGNVLRDYLTDLFPILELGTSAKMLSIVPLLAGGSLFETGAGGSAPKHVQQFTQENHLRWDSLGEFLALAVSVEDIAQKHKHKPAQVLADSLTKATSKLLNEGKSPLRKAGELDNRGSHYYLSLFWAEALAEQGEDAQLAEAFKAAAQDLRAKEGDILAELKAQSGSPVELKGYFQPDAALAEKAMRPSKTFNTIIDRLC